MDETQTLAVQALRDLLDNPDRDDWDELLAANRALIKAIAKNKPMTRNNARIVAEYLREAGWSEGAIGAATKPGPDLESSGGTVARPCYWPFTLADRHGQSRKPSRSRPTNQSAKVAGLALVAM
jgi:hypothetical protein